MVDFVKLVFIFVLFSIVVGGLMNLFGVEDNISDEELDYIESTQMMIR